MDKVETIGDAYMVASGLPTVYERHAQEMCLLALELLGSVKDHVIEHLPERKTQLRIGLHTGSLVSAIKFHAPLTKTAFRTVQQTSIWVGFTQRLNRFCWMIHGFGLGLG